MIRTPSSIVVLCLLLGAACKKGTNDPTTTPPSEPSADDAGASEPAIPQDPDPPELAQARTSLILGDLAAVKSSLEPLIDGASTPSQARAAGIAAALFAIAAAEELAENAQEPAELAADKAEEVRDPEVRQLAAIAMGAYLIGIGDPSAAQIQLEEAAGVSPLNAELARLYLARAQLNQAFDEEDKLVDPGKLDLAQATYQLALESSQDAAIKGRALSGLAALAKYRGKTADVCTHARAASEQLERAGASEYLKEVPSLLAGEAKCH